jgi:hypothetical protein
MAEVAKVVVLPESRLVALQELLTLLLVWDEVELTVDARKTDDESTQEAFEQLAPLVDNGLVRVARRPLWVSDNAARADEARKCGIALRPV